MSKRIDKFFDKLSNNFDVPTRLSNATSAGSRILPPRSTQNDKSYGLRLDAGELINGKRKIYLQVNSAIDTPSLKDWQRGHGTHANLASATFDTQAQDRKAEANKVLQELAKEAKSKVG